MNWDHPSQPRVKLSASLILGCTCFGLYSWVISLSGELRGYQEQTRDNLKFNEKLIHLAVTEHNKKLLPDPLEGK